MWQKPFDADGDQLRVRNVRTANGSVASGNQDGSWKINTNGESGSYKLVFDITDGALTTTAEASVTVKHKALFTSFGF